MLVYGFKFLSRTVSAGLFDCPVEGAQRPFRERRVRRWFALFWIPLVPLNRVGEFVECEGCGATFDPVVLDAEDLAAFESQLMTALRHLAVAMLRADGQVTPEEQDAAVAVVSALGGRSYSRAELEGDLGSFELGGLFQQLRPFAGRLNAAGKRSLLEAALHLAASDGHVESRELDTMRTVAAALGVDERDIRSVLATATTA